MLSRAIAAVLAARLLLAPWAAAEGPSSSPGPIAAAAVQEAAKAASPPRHGEMPPGLKWTGIGLLIGGGGAMISGAVFCAADACGRNPEVGFALAGASLAAGVILLGIADRHRLPPAPSVTFGNGRTLVQQRITF
jgi:hypothetical protein